MAQRVVDGLDATTCDGLGKHWAQKDRHAQRNCIVREGKK